MENKGWERKIYFNKALPVFGLLTVVALFSGAVVYLAAGWFFDESFFLDFTPSAEYFYYPKTPARLLAYITGSLLIGLSFPLALRAPDKIYRLLAAVKERLILAPRIITLGLALTALTGFIYREQFFYTPVIGNEYFRISEDYKISARPEYINSTELINRYNLLGHDKLDIHSFAAWADSSICRRVGEGRENLRQFVDDYNKTAGLRFRGNKFYHPDNNFFDSSIIYTEGILCVIPGDNSPNLVDKLDDALAGKFFLHALFPPPDDKIFGADSYFFKTLPETAGQIINRGPLSHHLHLIIPAHEYTLGKPLAEITHQYGLGLTLIPAGLAKIFSGGYLGYGNFLRVSGLLFPAGFMIFILSFYALFKDASRIILPLMLFILNHFIQGHEVVRHSIGIAAYRILLDLPLLYLIHAFFSKKTPAAAIAPGLTALAALFLNFEFGLFMAAAALYAVFIHSLAEDGRLKWLNIFASLLLVAALCIGFKYFTVGRHTVEKYFLLGQISVPIVFKNIFFTLALFALYHLLYLFFLKRRYKYAAVFLFSAAYAETLLCYFLMSGIGNHLFIYIARILLPWVFIADFVIFELSTSKIWRHSLLAAAALISTGLIVLKFIAFEKERATWNRALFSHRIYEWNLPGTNFRSTMNPAYFEDSINLIKKYIPEPQREVFLISKYGPFLNLLSGTYSGFPHFDLAPSLLTPSETEAALAALRAARPAYIFADADIERPNEFDIVPNPPFPRWLALESQARAKNLNEMRKVYDRAAADYEKVESSQLLTVYRLKAAQPAAPEPAGGRNRPE